MKNRSVYKIGVISIAILVLVFVLGTRRYYSMLYTQRQIIDSSVAAEQISFNQDISSIDLAEVQELIGSSKYKNYEINFLNKTWILSYANRFYEYRFYKLYPLRLKSVSRIESQTKSP